MEGKGGTDVRYDVPKVFACTWDPQEISALSISVGLKVDELFYLRNQV
jgi:hypothetical protein